MYRNVSTRSPFMSSQGSALYPFFRASVQACGFLVWHFLAYVKLEATGRQGMGTEAHLILSSGRVLWTWTSHMGQYLLVSK